jgi:hypothetical protein
VGGWRLAWVVAIASATVAVPLSAGAARSAVRTTVVLHPGSTAAQAVPLPVTGASVQVTVSGLLTQQVGGGVETCWDAFWYNDCAGKWQDAGTVDSIWLVPPGWNGSSTSVRVLTSAVVAGSVYPPFNDANVYHLTLDLSGKQGWSLFAVSTTKHGGTWADWSGSFTLVFGAATSGKTVSKLATGSSPFGTPVTGTVALGGAVDIPSPSLPPSTTEVDESAQFSDADIAQMAAALKLALAADNRNRLLQALVNYCLVFVPNGSSYKLGLNDFASVPGACDKFATSVLNKSKTGKYRFLASTSSGCTAAFVPFWRAGTRVSQQMHNAALAAARNEVQASCTGSRSSRLTFKVAARGSNTLNQLLGGSVQAGIGATARTAKTAQLTVTWAQPRVRATPGS